MRTRGVFALLVAVAMGLSFTGASLAQTKTEVDVRKFEIIAVDGNNIVFRDQNGTHEINVPEDFRFTIDGKKLSAKELKPGMKGTATVTTKTTITPVTVTEVRQATVLEATDTSITVRGQDGIRRFTQAQLDDRGLQIHKDGKLVRVRDVRKGDAITATIVSKGPPVVLSEKEVEATLAQAAPAAAPAPAPAAAPPAPAPAAAPPAAAPAAAPAAQPATTPPPTSAPPAAAPAKAAQPPAAEGTSPWVWYLLVAIIILLAWFFLSRKKKKD